MIPEVENYREKILPSQLEVWKLESQLGPKMATVQIFSERFYYIMLF